MQKHSPAKSFELFFTPRFPLFFILGALVLAVMGNMLGDLAKSYLGDERHHLWLIFAVAFGLLIVLVLAAYGVGAIRARRVALSPFTISGLPNPQKYKGLIAFVSRREHIEKAIRYHAEKLQRVWLISTKDADDLAREIRDEFSTPDRRISIVPLADEWDLQAARAAVERIYNEQLDSLAEDEVIADFTGGTKPMTVGMIFACLSPSRRLEYVPARYVDNRPVEALDPVEYFLDSAAGASLPQPQTATADETESRVQVKADA